MTATLSPDAATVMTAHLAPGERLLWAGRPKQGLALRASDSFLFSFMTLLLIGWIWAIIALWRQFGITALQFSPVFPLFVTAFVFSHFWFDAQLRGRTFYGLTEQRAIFITYWLRQDINSVYLRELLELRFTRRMDGTGTLELVTDLGVFNGWGRGQLGYNRSQLWFPGARHFNFWIPPAFEMIANPLEVEQLILKARDVAKAAVTP